VYDKSITDHQAEKPSILTDIATQEFPNSKREFNHFSVKFDVSVVQNKIPTQAQAAIYLCH
jgi:hypothetical protein